MKTNAEILSFLNSLDDHRKQKVSKIRDLIFRLYPNNIETLSHKILNYKVDGITLCYFASQKHYISSTFVQNLLPIRRSELKKYNPRKSCISFRNELPYALLENLFISAKNYLH